MRSNRPCHQGVKRLRDPDGAAWREDLESRVADWWEGVEKRAMLTADPINPERVFWEASSRLPDKAIISADSGTTANWFARAIRVRKGMKASLSGTLATMCPAVPYATAAKFCFPDRVAVAFVGDGAMQMLGMNALITIAKYWREWQDPRLIVAILNNRDLNQVTWELRAMGDSPRIPETQDVFAFDYANYAISLGLGGIRVDDDGQVGPAWDRAFAADRPMVIDARTDPDVPTLPPHVTFSEARSFARAVLAGDPDTRGILWQTVRRATTR